MRWWLPGAIVAVTAAKVATARALDLFGDEAFYWQCGQRLALAYVDHPPLTAMLVRVGSEIFGESPLGVRSLFLVLGSILPLAMYWLALPLVGSRDARRAAALALTVPATALVGLIAIPDVPLLILEAVFLGAAVRALACEDRSHWWWVVGAIGAFGFLTHYRFVVAPLVVALYLIVFRRTDILRQPLVWAGGGLMLIGSVPAIWFNATSSFGPLRYYLTERHGIAITVDRWLDHLVGQLLLVSPLLYVVLLASLWRLLGDARRGDPARTMLVIFSLGHIGLYFLMAPFERTNAATEHWPIPGYLPLLVFAPLVLRQWTESSRRWLRWFARGAPVLGFLLVGATLIELATGRFHLGSVREQFVGWSEAVEGSRQYLAALPPPVDRTPKVIVADNYKLAANIERALHRDARIYVLDHHKNHLHGRAAQLDLWAIGEAALRRNQPGSALVVVEVSQIRSGQYENWMAHVGGFFSRLDHLGEVVVASPGKRRKEKIFRYFHGVREAEGDVGDVTMP